MGNVPQRLAVCLGHAWVRAAGLTQLQAAGLAFMAYARRHFPIVCKAHPEGTIRSKHKYWILQLGALLVSKIYAAAQCNVSSAKAFNTGPAAKNPPRLRTVATLRLHSSTCIRKNTGSSRTRLSACLSTRSCSSTNVA